MSITKEDIGELRNALIVLNGVVLRLLDKLPDDQEPSNTNKRDFRDELDRLFHSSSTGSMGIADIKAPETAEVCSSARVSRTLVTSNTPGCEWSGNKNQVRINGQITDGILKDDEIIVTQTGGLTNCIIMTGGMVHNGTMENCQVRCNSITLHGSKALASDTCVKEGGVFRVCSSGAIARHTTVFNGGLVSITSGASADYIRVLAGGKASVDGGYLGSAGVSSGGSLCVTGACDKVDNIHVCNFGEAAVYSCNVTVMNGYGNGNKLTVGSGALVGLMQCSDGDVTVLGGVRSCCLQNARLDMLRDACVHSALIESGARIDIGWHASSWRCTVRGGGKLNVSSTGQLTELNATGKNTDIYVCDGGMVNGGRIGEGASCHLGGYANTLDVSGHDTNLTLAAGGTFTMTRVYQGARVEICSSGNANAIEVYNGDIVVSSGGSVAEVNLKDGWLHVMPGGKVSRCIQSGGTIVVHPDAICRVENRNGSGTIETQRGGYSYVMHTEENDK